MSITLVLASLAALGLGVLALMAGAQRRQLAAAPPPSPPSWPGVSILKPLKGIDANLEENLGGFFRLDYPHYEILFGVDDPGDPALWVARRVAAAHPHVPCRVIVDGRRVGSNPKVNNLANLARHMQHDVLWISDSNTRVEPGTLGNLVAHLHAPGVGLVSSPFRGVAASALGGACESLQLNTFVMGGVSAMHRLLGGVCVVGKSMLLARTTLDAMGGFAFLASFLAEDQVSGEEVARLGLRTAVATRMIDNVLGEQTVASFLRRHLRWAKIRRRMSPAGYLGELLLNPVFLTAVGVAASQTVEATILFATTWLIKTALDAFVERTIVGVRRPLALQPFLTLIKDLLIGVAWPLPWFDQTVCWRGNRLRIGPRTLLVPLQPAPQPATLDPTPADA
ncbi:MAG: ceramide glucosyltransferase [Thermoanaerobaculaceae bacterium]|nr:ceramide glucosyltransferase [Thermoanaerobaculaceae bacterium]